jgi:hypothetical protein
MAYVEEIALEDAMQSYPKLPLFTVLDNWNPPTEFGLEDKPPPADIQLGFKANSLEEHFTACFVEEETPPDATMEAATQSLNRSEKKSKEAAEPRHPTSVDNH